MDSHSVSGDGEAMHCKCTVNTVYHGDVQSSSIPPTCLPGLKLLRWSKNSSVAGPQGVGKIHLEFLNAVGVVGLLRLT